MNPRYRSSFSPPPVALPMGRSHPPNPDRPLIIHGDKPGSAFARKAFQGLLDTRSLLRALLTKLQLARKRRATIRAFAALDDHILRDIGLERSSIAEFARALLKSPPMKTTQ